jgi:V-type H+-transporting ATPase subunit a
MKLAVIFAILQMSLGIFMKGVNSVYFRKPLDFIFEFIPQIVLLWALFGYMDLLIVGKWLTPVDVNILALPGSTEYDALNLSPSIITTMIDIFLAFGSNESTENGVTTTSYLYVINNQQIISLCCLAIAFITVPLMLCVKPCILNSGHKDIHDDVRVE